MARITDHVRPQLETPAVSLGRFIRSFEFKAGVKDVRKVRFYDRCPDGEFEYELGRLFATIVPPGMPLTIKGRINQDAIDVLELLPSVLVRRYEES